MLLRCTSLACVPVHCSKPGWRKTGVELLTELAELGVTGFTAMSEARARRLAYMYDAYHYVLRRLRLVDFDDMLHATLEMFKSRPEVGLTRRRGGGGLGAQGCARELD